MVQMKKLNIFSNERHSRSKEFSFDSWITEKGVYQEENLTYKSLKEKSEIIYYILEPFQIHQTEPDKDDNDCND